MTQILNKLLLNRCIYILSKDSKRFAGHSKWQNIKHIKEEKDHERMMLFHHLKLQMKIAIQEGKTAKPSQNQRLAQLIERAKKVNMPAASIKSFLEKMEERKNKSQAGIIEIRGPNGYVMLVHYITDNAKMLTMEISAKLKKTSGRIVDSSVRNMFTHVASIIVDKKGDLEQAMEDALNIGAEDVEQFKENDEVYFQFKCDPNLVNKTKNLLEGLQYHVISTEEDYIPHNIVKLTESDLEVVSQIHDKIMSFEDINHIYDNIE